MTRRLCVVLACVLAPVTLLSACGGSGNSNTKPSATSGLSIKTIKELNKKNTARSYSLCQQAAANPGLPADQKPIVQAECAAIQSGDYAALHRLDRQLCVVEAKLKPKPLRTTLLAQCKTL
jgi:hypothetical protein